jgi:2-iminobutanoate/2-iminopropanoate deaminase
MAVQKINVSGVGRLPAFCHATVAGGVVYVSGTLGTLPDSFDLVPGGTGPQTRQTLENIEKILAGAGCTKADVVKVNVFLTDLGSFQEMNAAYLAFFGDAPPARITVGCSALALGAAVEIDCIAHQPA